MGAGGGKKSDARRGGGMGRKHVKERGKKLQSKGRVQNNAR